jgi:hypothetical protein
MLLPWGRTAQQDGTLLQAAAAAAAWLGMRRWLHACMHAWEALLLWLLPALASKPATLQPLCWQVACPGQHFQTPALMMPSRPHTLTHVPLQPLQFINAHPSTGPGGLWPNSWINSQRTGPERLAGTTDVSSGFK